jgi:aspartate aminotransferase
MKARGIDVVSFAAGEPDFNTPQPVCDAAVGSIVAGFTKYTPTVGIIELRKAVCEKLSRENGIRVTPEQVVISSGAKQAVYQSLQVLLDPGDEVILVAPYWMTYAEQIRLSGGTPVLLHAKAAHGFVPEFEAIREAVTSKTKAILLNSPNNPTGAVWPRQTIKEIAAIALRHGLWVIADEIYEKLVYGEEHVSIASLGADIADQTITINGCSKTYSMTGWRIGYSAAPLAVAKAIGNLQDQITSCPTSFAQRGAVVALGLPPETVNGMRREFEGRRDLIVERVNRIPGVNLSKPGGAFYAFADFSGILGGRVKTDLDLAEFLLEEAKVATVPGSVFEAPGFLRLSYAASRHDIERGVARISEAVTQLNS